MPSYTRPPGTEGSQWENFREETGGSDDRAEFQSWLTRQQMQGRYEDLTDFNSPYYKQFGDYLRKTTPTFGTDQALAQQRVGGSSFAAGGVIAKEQAEAFNKSREDFLNTTVSGFALQSQGQADTILGGLMQNNQFQQGLNQQRYEFEESQPDFWDTALAFAAPIASIAAAPFTGGASLLALPAAMSIGKGSQGGASSPTPVRPYTPEGYGGGYDQYGGF